MTDAYDPFDNMAVDRTIGTLDEPPEDAARAIDLGKKTGASPVAIHADLEEFENNAKAATTAQLIRGNRHISDYINSHPLAGIVSNGDLHNLDEASGKMKALPAWHPHPAGSAVGDITSHLPEDFIDLLTESGKSLAAIPKDINQFTIPSDEVRQAIDTIRKDGADFHNVGTLVGSINNAIMSSLISGLDPMAQYRPVNVGAQDLLGGIMGTIGTITGVLPLLRSSARELESATPIPKEFSEQVAMLGMMFMGLRGGKSHVKGGEIPPPGLSKETDSIREHRSKENLRALDEATKSIQSTSTNQLSPDLAREFAGQHVEDRNIHVSVEAVRKLYGDKLPEAEDGMLGWVEGLGEQIQANAEVGKDIAIPLKDWLTKVDPEVAKILHDDIRVTRDDVTNNEAKRYKELQPEEPTVSTEGDPNKALADEVKAFDAKIGEKNRLANEAQDRGDKALRDQLFDEADQLKIQQKEAQARLEKADKNRKPPVQNINLSRRGFLKGVGATVATAATGKVPKLEVNPFEAATPAINEMFQRNVEWTAAENFGFAQKLYGENSVRQAARTLDAVAGRLKGEGAGKVYEEAAKLIRSGWIPPKELLDQVSKIGEFGQDIEPSEMTRKMVEEDHMRPSEAAEIGNLPWPEEYMKGAYPKGLIEPSVRETVRKHQDAIDETRNAAKLSHFIDDGKMKFDLVQDYLSEDMKEHPQTKEPLKGPQRTVELNVSRAGESKGYVTITPLENGKLLHVDYMGHGGDPWKAGMQSAIDLIDAGHELQLMFPEAKDIGGLRVSGAHAEEPKYRRVPLDRLALYKIFTGSENAPKGWERVEPGPIEPMQIKLGKPEKFVAQTGATARRFSTTSIGTTTVKNAFSQLDFEKSIGGPIGGALNILADRIANKVGHVLIHAVKDDEFNLIAEQKGVGFYNASTHQIVVSESGLRNEAFAPRLILHESVHAATSRALHTDMELNGKIETLMDHVKALNLGKEKSYGFTSTHEFITEAMTNPEFQRLLIDTKIDPAFAEALGVRQFSHIKTLWDAFIHHIGNWLGIADKPELVSGLEAAVRVFGEAFDKQLSMEDMLKIGDWRRMLAEREDIGPLRGEHGLGIPQAAQPTAFRGKIPSVAPMAKQGELDVTRMESKKAFATPTALGINKEWYQKYQDLIEKQQGEDAKRQMEIALKRAEQIQTKEWKDTQDRISKEVEDQIRARPDIAVDEALRKGTLGEGTTRPGGRRLRLNAEELTEEQKGVLDKSEYSTGGIHPDDLAGYFGYPSGDAMLERLGQFREFVKETYASSEAFVKAAAREETAKRMEQEFGDLGQKILEEARDHVLSETQLDLMHEELVGLAMQAGMEISITKEQMKTLAKNAFDKHVMGDLSTAEYLRLAGKHGLELEKAMLDQDWKTAFKAKQAQTLATMMAQEAKKIEKAKKVWDRNAKRFAKREVSGIDQRYTNAIHDIMFRTGSTPKPRRTPTDLAEAFRRDGWSDISPLKDFVEDRAEAFRELAVPEWLQDPRFEKDFDSLTAGQFREANEAVKSLIKNGRDEQKVFSEGNAADLAEVFEGMHEQIKDLPIQEDRIDRPEGRLKKWLGTAFWAHVNLESMMNRLDRGKIGGLFKKYIMFPIAEASNTKDAMMKKYQGQVAELGKIKDMDKLVENNLFIDPRGDGKPFIMRKRNVLGVLQNVGNASNLEKLAKGYGVSPENVMAWLKRNTTSEDWDRAQKLGKIFEDLFEQGARMQHELSGSAPVKVLLTPFIDPFGQVREGWYNPVKYDRKRPGNSPRLIGRSALEDEGYFRATIPTGFLTERTGYIAPMELNLDIVPIRMRQMIHDIAMRPSVIQASKFFYNPEFNRMIREAYGDKPVEEFVPFLRDVANSPNFTSFAESVGNQALEFFRQNMIATFIGWNPGTVMKHGTTALFNSLQQMGYRDFAYEMTQLMRIDSKTGERNWSMAMEKSEELQRRMRNFKEIIEGHGSEINIRGSGVRQNFDTMREFAMQLGAMPVATSDLLSSVPTWLVAYKRAIMKGETEGAAITQADLAVRQTHGSSVSSNKPSIMRGGGALRALYSSLYGFFSHMFQKQYEMAWKAKDAMGLAKEGEYAEATKRIPELASLFVSYVIVPALIEELVTPYSNSDRDSWGKKIAKTLAFGISSSTIGVRDFVHGFIGGRDAQPGLGGSMFKTIADFAKDLGRGTQQSPDQVGKMLTHVFSMFGLLTGLTNQTQGKMAEYLYRVNKNLEKPKGPWEVGTGLRYGRTKGHSKTMEEYVKHLQGH